jgi:hypothetical protein
MEVALAVGQREQVLNELLIAYAADHVVLLLLLLLLPQLVQHVLVFLLNPHDQIIVEFLLFLVFLLD